MNFSWFRTSIVTVIFLFFEFSEGQRRVIICQGDRKTISCKGKRVLSIVSSTYGRSNMRTCRSPTIGRFRCGSQNNALSKTRQLCDGKKKCTIFSSNSIFQDPCPGTSVYLTVEYECDCGPRFFKCKNENKCINKRLVCNGKRNCNDGSDEVNCPTKGCGRKRFKCKSSGKCIHERKRCNGRIDCPDGSDELLCGCRPPRFQCKGSRKCIPKRKRCNGRYDCPDGSDEAFCECTNRQFKCKKSGQCIPKNRKCDGNRDCPDGSDEIGCGCTSSQFACADGQQCIPKKKVCDRYPDCKDGSDEKQNCPCTSSEFSCADGKQCIPKDKVCDRYPDCKDGSDEKQNCPCISSEFACADGKQCIPLSKKCDGTPDCNDRSDENCPASQCGVQAIQPDIKHPDCPKFKLWRIVGGCSVRPKHSWPWVLQLILDVNKNGKFEHECGAALISESYAITASHCFLTSKDTNRWKVVAGRHKKVGQEPTHQIRKVSKILSYPNPLNDDYNPLDKDITLIKFDKPMKYTDYVSPVCLPQREPVINDICIVAGWGETQGTGNESVLKNTIMPVVSNDKCNGSDALKNQITKYMFCAGFQEGKNDACQGDSGGPLMCQINNAWHVSGIVSWGIDCAKPEIPGVYANVYKFVDWIKGQMSIN